MSVDIMAKDESGKYVYVGTFGDPTKVHTYSDNPIETPGNIPVVSLRNDLAGSFELYLTQSDRKKWGKIFMMPKWQITQWAFPRKKPRARMRRARRKHQN